MKVTTDVKILQNPDTDFQDEGKMIISRSFFGDDVEIIIGDQPPIYVNHMYLERAVKAISFGKN